MVSKGKTGFETSKNVQAPGGGPTQDLLKISRSPPWY